MNREEHVGMAREFTRRADEESRNGGNELIAAEFLWGTLAPLSHRGGPEPRTAPRQPRRVPENSTAPGRRQRGNQWRSSFGAAEQLHSHFYHGDLTDDELQTHRQAAAEGIQELMGMLGIL